MTCFTVNVWVFSPITFGKSKNERWSIQTLQQKHRSYHSFKGEVVRFGYNGGVCQKHTKLRWIQLFRSSKPFHNLLRNVTETLRLSKRNHGLNYDTPDRVWMWPKIKVSSTAGGSPESACCIQKHVWKIWIISPLQTNFSDFMLHWASPPTMCHLTIHPLITEKTPNISILMCVRHS